jgi:Flp pilus assembly protein CpaB
MRSRGLVVAIAVVLAVLAAVGVIVYTSNVRETAVNENTTTVLASTQDIQANTPLDPLISQGVFQPIQVPNDGVVPGAVIDQSQLEGQTAVAPIYQNEQIPLARISAGVSNTYGVDPGNIGIGLEVTGQAAVNGVVQQGDNITIYATFRRGTLVTKQGLKVLLTPAQMSKAFAQALGGVPVTGSASTNVFQVQTDFTIALVPSVEVLAVQNPPVDTTSGRIAAGASIFLLNMDPTDAQELIFATDHATLYLGLLPPENKDGYAEPGTIGVPFGKVIGVST